MTVEFNQHNTDTIKNIFFLITVGHINAVPCDMIMCGNTQLVGGDPYPSYFVYKAYEFITPLHHRVTFIWPNH